jgi:hypothetical protein
MVFNNKNICSKYFFTWIGNEYSFAKWCIKVLQYAIDNLPIQFKKPWKVLV